MSTTTASPIPIATLVAPQGVELHASHICAGGDRILTTDALTFLAALHRQFETTRQSLLRERVERQRELDAGKLPDFLPSTAEVRASSYKGPSIPHDLVDRRVEITGPTSRKMLINALNSGASAFMADLEDSTSPTWYNVIDGQINLFDAVRRTISFFDKGKHYELKEKTATLLVRPRGWHLNEAHIVVDGASMSASLVDFGLFFFHNAKELINRGSGPYFYLPKMEGHKEARLWNSVFVFAQQQLGVPVGTIRATCLIETILAAFEMDEIIYELREHSAGLNCGRWDYIFSFIKKFRTRSEFVLPDRASVTMLTPFMTNYVRLLIHTCHKRGVHAMGGMAAQIPINNDAAANEAAFAKVRADKLREVQLGHDGTWVAHPGLIPVAMDVFNTHMPTPNQLHVKVDAPEPVVDAKALLDLGPKLPITEAGLKGNIEVGIGYVEPWLRGVGCVPLHNLMEDAATAEISRCQLWQWQHHGASMSTGVKVTAQLLKESIAREATQLRERLGEQAWHASKYEQACKLFAEMVTGEKLDDFLTLVAYPYIVEPAAQTVASKL